MGSNGFSIVNFQPTEFDFLANVRLNADIDYVMTEIAFKLGCWNERGNWEKKEEEIPLLDKLSKRNRDTNSNNDLIAVEEEEWD